MRFGLLLALLLAISSPSWAATVSSAQGRILLNTGNGFRAVQAPTAAGAGARVVANPGGQGLIQYDDGCTVTVNPGQVYIVAVVSPCSTGQLGPPDNGFAVGAAVIGGTVGLVILLNGLNPASP